MPSLPVRSTSLALLLTTCCVAEVAAQTTWIVDQAGGPGSQFTNLTPAIAAASDGDLILIRPGNYAEGQLDVDKGLTILGETGVVVTMNVFGTAGMTIHDLPATSAFAMRDLRIGGQLAGPPVAIVDCAGLVLLDKLEGPIGGLGLPENFGVHVESCQQVHLHGLLVRGGQSVRFENSVGTVTRCTLEGGIAGVVQLVDSDVTFDRSVVNIEPTVSFAPPMQVDGGRVTLSRSSVEAPISPQTPHPAIVTQGSAELRVDPTASLVPTAGQPAISGPAIVSNGEVDTLSRDGTGVITFDLHGRAGSIYGSYATLPAATTALPFGVLWLDLNPAVQLPITAGVVTTRQQSFTLDTTPLPLGLRFVVQAGVLDPSLTLALSNGVGALAN
jgi:hypothetical protein